MTSAMLLAMLAAAGLCACAKTTDNAPAEVQPAVRKQVAIPGPAIAPAPLPGRAAPAGPAGAGQQGAPDKPGDTVLVLPEKH